MKENYSKEINQIIQDLDEGICQLQDNNIIFKNKPFEELIESYKKDQNLTLIPNKEIINLSMF